MTQEAKDLTPLRGTRWTVRGDRADGTRGTVLTVKIRQPSHEFTFGVGISFIPYPLVLIHVV
jgi:hypothetical protein